MSIEVRNLQKRFGTTVVCDNLSLDIPAGELVALLGPSGSGKTTLLRIIAGLEVPDSGSVLFHGEDATEADVRERRVGFVFQHYALFGHMTIFENVAFGLRVRPKAVRPEEAKIRAKVAELLALVQLDRLADRYPHQLSGGQRQRIALARALAVEPKVLLLDEPFGALDAKVRKELRRWLRRLHDEMHVTSVFVTHDQEEAMEVADRIVVMNQGRIEQDGAPDEVYDHPASPFVLQFLGDVNLFRGASATSAAGRDPAGFQGDARTAYVRPHELQVVASAQPGSLPVTLVQALTVGPNTRLEFRRARRRKLCRRRDAARRMARPARPPRPEAGRERAPVAAQGDALRERRRRPGRDDLTRRGRYESRCLRARCTRTNRFSSLMPSSAQIDSVDRSSTTRIRIASRSVGGSRSIAASARASSSRCSAISSGPGCGQATAWPGLSLVSSLERFVVAGAAQHIDDLVLEHRGEPGAQRGAATEDGAAGEHRLEHVVDRVLGEARVAELAKREAQQVRPMRDQLGDRDRHRGDGSRGTCRRADWLDAASGQRAEREGGIHARGAPGQSMSVTLAGAYRNAIAKDHSQITSL